MMLWFFHSVEDKGDSNEAISVCKNLNEMDPSSGLGKIGIGFSLLIEGDYRRARDVLREGNGLFSLGSQMCRENVFTVDKICQNQKT